MAHTFSRPSPFGICRLPRRSTESSTTVGTSDFYCLLITLHSLCRFQSAGVGLVRLLLAWRLSPLLLPRRLWPLLRPPVQFEWLGLSVRVVCLLRLGLPRAVLLLLRRLLARLLASGARAARRRCPYLAVVHLSRVQDTHLQVPRPESAGGGSVIHHRRRQSQYPLMISVHPLIIRQTHSNRREVRTRSSHRSHSPQGAGEVAVLRLSSSL